ncbi:hypothetical protein MUY21_15210 [Aliiroseovarius sp. S2029]|uniref:hypothetical protein n=1 Tax=Aliiroseovarius sp. S2029 TaxID=2936988 RepID=UPI0020BE1B4C|nr:hypothetical protein [Aliiroseovarius sp. S2029]MCK8485390.1 hypothetical protein [Aliiroseovarius sp. S2029]
MSIRITIACPEHLMSQANQFALCVGNSPADVQTFGAATWEDGAGERYALASLLAGVRFPQLAAAPLAAPAHAPDADIAGATQAQSVLRIWSPASTDSFPEVGVDRLVAVIGLEAGLAIPLLGLSPIPTED